MEVAIGFPAQQQHGRFVDLIWWVAYEIGHYISSSMLRTRNMQGRGPILHSYKLYINL